MPSWLPPDSEPKRRPKDWWQPKAVAEWLAAQARWDLLSYVVVDELQEGVAGLVVSPWPRIDRRGRLHFGSEEKSSHVTTSAAALLAVLRDRRLPIVPVAVGPEAMGELAVRDISIGDVFAARVPPPFRPGRGRRGPPPDGGSAVEPSSWLMGDVLDITAEAREVAKAQAAAAAAGVVDEAFLDAIKNELGEGEAPPEPTPEGSPTPTGSGSSGGAQAAPTDQVQESSASEQSSTSDPLDLEQERIVPWQQIRELEEQLRQAGKQAVGHEEAEMSEAEGEDEGEEMELGV
jgi:hypothetical protein